MVKIYISRASQEKDNIIFEKIVNGSTVITPEQSTLLFERKIIENKALKGLIDINVTSFSRISSKLIDVFTQQKEAITPVGKQMLFRYILNDLKDEFKLFKNSYSKEGFIEEIIKTIDFFENEGVSLIDLKDLVETIEENLIKDKVVDLILIYEEYIKRMRENYYLKDYKLELFKKHAYDFKFYNDEVWILGFNAFDNYTLKMIESINKNVKSLNIALSYEENFNEIYEITSFTIKELRDRFDVEIIDLNIKDSDYSLISKDIINDNSFINETNMQLFISKDYYSEIEYIGLDILKKKNEDNSLKANDFKIVVLDDDYYFIIESIFNSMGIDVFRDKKRKVTKTKTLKMLLSVMNMYLKNFQRDDVLSFLKNYVDLNKLNKIDEFENYIIENGINYGEFLNSFKDEKIEKIRIEYLEKVIAFKEKFKSKNTPKNFSINIINLLNELKITEKINRDLSNSDSEQKEVLKQLWQKLKEVLTQLAIVTKDELISFKEYKLYFDYSLKDLEIGVIPQNDNAVIVTSVDRTIHSYTKYLYIVGASDTKFPKEYSDNDLFSNFEKELLKEKGYSILSSINSRNALDRLAYFNILSQCDKAIISYSIMDLDYKSNYESIYVKRAINKFSLKIIDSTINDNYLKDRYFLFDTIKYRYSLFSIKERRDEVLKGIDKEDIELLKTYLSKDKTYLNIDRKKDINTSATRIENYSSCPYSYFLKYDLKLDTVKEFDIDALIVGNYYHNILEKALKSYNETNVYDIDKLSDEIIKEDIYRVFLKTKKNEYLFNTYKEKIKFIVSTIIEKLDNSSFKATKFEKEIYVKNDNYILNGKVDRIDTFDNYFSIIDYKSSNKRISLDELYNGINMQLLLYLKAYHSLNKDLVPAGIFYLKVDNPYAKSKKNPLKERKDMIKLSGYFIGDEKLSRKYDHILNEESSSSYIPVRIKKDGTFYNNSKTMDLDTLKKLYTKVDKNAKEIVQNINEGDISIYPREYNNFKACTYCDYNSICRFNEYKFKKGYRKVENLSDSEIIDKLNKDILD